jgi:YesN/AraC family two-component response regulator
VPPLEVSEASEGTAALTLVRESEFHIVFIDQNMPDLSGLETLSGFKRENSDVKTVLITSARDDELARHARDLGASFLRRPFFPWLLRIACAQSEATLTGGLIVVTV